MANPKHIVISLPVADLERSLRFYRDGMGLPAQDIDEGIVPVQLQAGVSLFLIDKNQFAEYAQHAGVRPHLADGTAQSILSFAVESSDEVDNLLKNVQACGALFAKAKEQPWGYTAYVRDPDGHLWEIVWSRRS